MAMQPLNDRGPRRTVTVVAGQDHPQRPALATGAAGSRGLGDTVARLTRATGIDRLVKKLTGGRDCGCAKRQAWLNRAFPYKSTRV